MLKNTIKHVNVIILQQSIFYIDKRYVCSFELSICSMEINRGKVKIDF